jgi:hypothetical protein
MKKFLLFLIPIFFISCTFRKNGIGIWELDCGTDFSLLNNFGVYPPKYKERKKYYTINGKYFNWQDETWKEYQINRYDFLYNRAIEKGKNPHWYIDRHFNEGEERTRN